MSWRQGLAAVLALGLGAVLIVHPAALVRVHTLGRVPGDRGGSYGQDKPVPDRWQHAIRALGVLCIGFGLYFGYQFLG